MKRLAETMPLAVGAEDAAGLLGISKRQWWALDKAGAVPSALKLGGRKVWAVEELKAWLRHKGPSRNRWEEIHARLQAEVQ